MKELVIKIPEHLYKLLKDLPSDSNEGTIENVLMKAVENGTPLPKVHGRLIDADAEIKQMYEKYCENCDRRRGMKDGKLTKHFVYDIGDAPCRACDTGDMIDYLEDAPTILEATEGEENANSN